MSKAKNTNYTLTLIFSPDKSKVLMEKHKKQGALNFVGGHIEADEDEMEASYRELYEETGIRKDDVDLIFVQTEHCTASFASPEWRLYIAAGILKDDITLKEEKNELVWIPVDRVDVFLYSTFGEGNCYVFLKRAQIVLGERGNNRLFFEKNL